MRTITITFPDEVATQIAARHISQAQLDAFVVTAVQAWLNRRQGSLDIPHVGEARPWSEAFRDSSTNGSLPTMRGGAAKGSTLLAPPPLPRELIDTIGLFT
jgi:hypothetical protein